MGDGAFTAITTVSVGGGSPFAIAAADMNADQKIDLVTAHNNSNNVKLIKATAARTYAVPTTAETFAAGAGPYAIALGDIDGKNGPDIVVANNGSSNVSLLLNSGGNAFATQVTSGTDAQPTAVLLGSFANTKLDFATANKNGNSATVRLNNGTNGFSSTATTISTGAKNPTAIVAGDWNADGKMDLAMANSGDMLAVIALGQGNGSFTAGTNPTVSTALGDHTIATADFNLDGKPDLAIANEKTGDVSILLGNGDGTFGAMTSFPVGTTPGSISIADLNKDSFPDLITTDRGANSVVIRLGQCS